MKRRVVLKGWLSVVWLIAASSFALAATVSGPDNRVITRTGGDAAGLEVGFIPKETWLEPKEGDIGRASMLVKVNPTTFVVPAGPPGGEEPGFDSPKAGLVHCYGQGTSAAGCEFIPLGPLSDERAPLVVSSDTVVVQGLGPDREDCEVHGVARLGIRRDIEPLCITGASPTCPSGSPTCPNFQGTVECSAASPPTCSSGSPTCTGFYGSVSCSSGSPSCATGSPFCSGSTPICFQSPSCGLIGVPFCDGSTPACGEQTVLCVGGSPTCPSGSPTCWTGSLTCSAGIISTPICQGESERRNRPETEPADDVLHVVKGLGSKGAHVVSVPTKLRNLCSFAHSTDPIRINDDTIAFTQPGPDLRFGVTRGTEGLPSGGAFHCGAAFDDEIVIVKGLSTGSVTVTVMKVGKLLRVHLGGSAASRPVRVSDTLFVVGSPGKDGHFASSDSPACGATAPEPNDDGLIIVNLTTNKVSFLKIGSIPGNPNGRAVRVNNSAVALMSTGPNQEESKTSACDDVLVVVEKLDTSTPKKTTFSGLGFVRRPLRLNRGAIVAFEDKINCGGEAHAHVVRGIHGSDDAEPSSCLHFDSLSDPEDKDVLVTGPTAHFAKDVEEFKENNVGLVLNCNQAAVFTTDTSNRQAYLVTNTTGTPMVTASSTAGGSDWDQPKATVINGNTILYTANAGSPQTNNLGVLKASSDGSTFTDTRQTLPTHALGASCGHWGGSANHPVRVSDKRGVVLTEGDDCEFGVIGSTHADDGLILLDGLTTGTGTLSFVKTGRACGAPGCKPVALGGSSPDLVVHAGPGANSDVNEDVTLCAAGRSSCCPEVIGTGEPLCAVAFFRPTCTSGGVIVCDSSNTISCTTGSLTGCPSGSSPNCTAGTPLCDTGASPTCSDFVTCSSGFPTCTQGFRPTCPSSGLCSGAPSCTAKDDDELIVVTFP